MFVDMKNSTTLAERLGHLKFSALVRDFMSDLTRPVLETRGEVSHYIGDEAVLTWQMRRGLTQSNVIRCFYLMESQIAKRADYYRAAYGLVPEFKAGAHCGMVVTTEVGEIKSEIVFHGDVLNTAARIPSLCNEFGHTFLISEDLAALVSPPPGSAFLPLGRHLLKGKVRELGILAVVPMVGDSATGPASTPFLSD